MNFTRSFDTGYSEVRHSPNLLWTLAETDPITIFWFPCNIKLWQIYFTFPFVETSFIQHTYNMISLASWWSTDDIGSFLNAMKQHLQAPGKV